MHPVPLLRRLRPSARGRSTEEITVRGCHHPRPTHESRIVPAGRARPPSPSERRHGPGLRALAGGALVVAAAALAWVASRPPVDTSTVVVVAARDLEAGALLVPADLATASVDGPDVVVDALIRDPDTVLGARTAVALTRGAPLRVDDTTVRTDAPAAEVAVELEPDAALANRLRVGGSGDRLVRDPCVVGSRRSRTRWPQRSSRSVATTRRGR